LTLLAAESRSILRQSILVCAGLAFCVILDDEALPSPVPLWAVWLTLCPAIADRAQRVGASTPGAELRGGDRAPSPILSAPLLGSPQA
jgi:hypothetical protein